MKRPLAGLVLVYAAGIWLGSMLAWPMPLLWGGVASLLVAFLLLQRTRSSLAVLLTFVCAVGMVAYRLHATNFSPNYIAHLLALRDQNVTMRGTIVSDTGYRADANDNDEADANERHNFRLRLDAIQIDDQWHTAEGRVLVFISEARAQVPLYYGDVIECSALLRVPLPARNPGVFDWRGWLARQNIPFTATLRKSDDCRIVARDRGNRLIALSLHMREHFERALRLGLENEPKLASVLAGMVIGERSEIPPQTYADFQNTGVFHVFAISGLHVGLVTAIIVIALRLLRVSRRWCGLVAIPLLVLYVFATGARPGAVRALVMVCVWLGGWMLVRPTDLINSLAAAALIILAWSPTQLFAGGFVLSFTVVTALVVLTPGSSWWKSMVNPKDAVERKIPWWKLLVSPDPFLPRQFVPRWRRGVERIGLWVVRIVGASLAAWIGLIPLMAVYFHLFTPISVLANVLVIPMLGSIIALGLLSAVAYPWWSWLTLTLNNANFFLLSTMIHGVEWLGRVPFGHQFVRAPPAWLSVGYYALGVLLLSRRISWSRRKLAAVIGAPALGAAALFTMLPQHAVELTVLDLTDGPSVFINAPGERNDWLIDGGGDWSGARQVAPFLRAQGVDQLDAIVLTRGDKAHAAGLSNVVGQIPIGRAIHSGTSSRSKFFWDWLEITRAARIPITTMRAGDEVTRGDGLRVRVLNPPRGKAFSRSDDNSLVLLLEFGPTRVLLMSDAGETVERRLVAGGQDLHAQIIIKGRHSTETSCTESFLAAVRPDAVVQIVNTQPSTRYLQPDVRGRLQQHGIRFYRTDETGAVTIRLKRDGYEIRTWLAQN
jgi:competence protein ComEC